MLPRTVLGLLAVLILVAGCGGPSADEWQAAQRDVGRLKADLDAANKRHSDDELEYADAEKQIEYLKAKLGNLGIKLKTDPIGQLHGQRFTNEQIVDLVLKDAHVPAAPSEIPPGWKQVYQGPVSGSATCQLTVSVAFQGEAARVAAMLDTSIRTASFGTRTAAGRTARKRKPRGHAERDL